MDMGIPSVPMTLPPQVHNPQPTSHQGKEKEPLPRSLFLADCIKLGGKRAFLCVEHVECPCLQLW